MFNHLIPANRKTLDGFPLFIDRAAATQPDPPAWLIIKETPRSAILATDLFGQFGASVSLAQSVPLVDLIY